VFNDLREFIASVESLGECRLITGADRDQEIGALGNLLSKIAEPPMLLFDKIAGYEPGYRVVTNLFATHKRTALALDLPVEASGLELVRALKDKLSNNFRLIPPVEVATGSVKENVITGDAVDVLKFPAPKWSELDGGPYIGTGSACITRDPDEDWVNLGTYRVQVHDRNTVTASMVPGHHGEMIRRKYWDRGVPCPIAISCGQEPALFAAASWEGIPWGQSEYDYAGGLRGEPVNITRGVTTDLPIPATAEIVLEGEILPPEQETRKEGPFGEWAGYYAGGVREMPAIKIKSILHRDNPIIQGNPASRFPQIWNLGRHLQKAASLWNELDRQVPGIKGVWMIEEASIHSIPVVSLKQSYPGHAKQVGLLAASAAATTMLATFVIVVDDDIDPSNLSEVMWALGTRVEPAESIDIVHGCRAGNGFPMLSPEKKKTRDLTMSRAIVLACKPFWWLKDFPPTVETSQELAKKVREKFPELFTLIGGEC